MSANPLLAITMGDVNGIGPEILAKALARPEPWAVCEPVILGDKTAYDQARRFALHAPEAVAISDLTHWQPRQGQVALMDAGHAGPLGRPGALDAEAGSAAVAWIVHAARLAKDGVVAGMVTCPINKEGIALAGCPHAGHTSLIAEVTGAADYRMCLFTDTMRIVHITAHLSLRDAVAAVKRDRILESIRIGHDALNRIQTPQQRIAVAGLNPHAGENGQFGREEIEEIRPAVAQARAEGIDCSGPWPPDTVFKRMRDGEFEMVIAMYHDQGHIPLKLIAMDEGVNVTLGIPIVRTSVDHGTAYDIAGKGIAREHSLCAAIRLAAQLSQRQGVRA
jgi:4-hydroxythreonine-4-phosphate dehydrogenase